MQEYQPAVHRLRLLGLSLGPDFPRATKLPQYLVSNRAALDRYFNEELARLRTDQTDLDPHFTRGVNGVARDAGRDAERGDASASRKSPTV